MIKVELQNVYGTDKDVASSAWTSSLDYQKKQTRTDDDVKRVVNMLADSGHSTPFESIILRFWMKVPIQTDRQIMTHRLQSTSGMSGRYRTMPKEYLEIPEDIKQIFPKLDDWFGIPEDYETGEKLQTHSENIIQEYNELCSKANNWYEEQIYCNKVAREEGYISNDEFKRLREFFRGVLPQNNMTERVSIMNLRAFCNFIKLRNSPHAQPEIRKVAELMLEQVKQHPEIKVSIEALEKNNWNI